MDELGSGELSGRGALPWGKITKRAKGPDIFDPQEGPSLNFRPEELETFSLSRLYKELGLDPPLSSK